LSVVFGAELEMTLSVQNREAQAFPFENAMHSYFAVGDVRRCSLTGLHRTRYLDRNLGQRECVQSADPLRFAAATDHTYLGTEATCVIDDPVYRRQITIAKQGSRSTIVWNPWSAWAERTADFGDDEWQRMLCVESGNIGEDAITLASDAEHQTRVIVRCADA
jgi:glucose-6-phosphate 1-epimerase